MSNFYIKSGATSGSGNNDVVISTTSANRGRESIKGRFRVTFDNKEFATISLEQNGVGEQLNITDYTQSLDANESVVTITGTANVNTIVSSIAGSIRVNGSVITNWDGINRIFITGDPGKTAIYNYTITVNVGRNTSSSSRNIQITLSDGDKITRTLNVFQAANGDTPVPPSDTYIYFSDSISTAIVNFTSNGGTQTSYIRSNTSWRLAV